MNIYLSISKMCSFLFSRGNQTCARIANAKHTTQSQDAALSAIYIEGTRRGIVIHSNICSSELARMYGMIYISQLGSVKNTNLAARNLILPRVLTARNQKRYQPARNILNQLSDRPQRRATIMKHHRTS